MTRATQRFSATANHEIACGTHDRLSLRAIDQAIADSLADQIAQMDPWRTLDISASGLSLSLVQEDHGAFKRALWLNDDCAGVIRIQDPWLYGPYLALLAILPGHQGAGLGAAVLRWMECEVRGSSNNIWACVSSFNSEALRFYRRHGFEPVGVIPDLLRSGFSEVLIRKRLQ